jgi:hypothetical protein
MKQEINHLSEKMKRSSRLKGVIFSLNSFYLAKLHLKAVKSNTTAHLTIS